MAKNGKKENYEKVWDKNFSSKKDQRDSFGKKIKFKDYGKDVSTGWEVDHIRPTSKKGSDSIQNLQPLNSKNNKLKSDNLQGKVGRTTYKVTTKKTVGSKIIGKMKVTKKKK